MNKYTHAGIAYIVCRLISGKRAAALYDVAGSDEVDMTELSREGFLREFDEQHQDYIPGYADECSYRFASSSGYSVEIFINLKTFILHVCGSSAYFIGNVRGDTIYLYDHKSSAHFRFRVIRYAGDREKTSESVFEKNS
ncbi:MAG: hypothetical protein M0Z67_07900 [Nitrospiraceae bacterium]|nr:hypothetical protein [Nitrospiraceae bacterium]